MLIRRFDNPEARKALKKLHKKVVAQADAMRDGWIVLRLPYDRELGVKAGKVRIAKIPFERWAFGTDFHREKEWTNVAPSSLKMQLDDRNHSDWWLSTGMAIDYSECSDYDYKYEKKNDWNPCTKKQLQELARSAQINRAAWAWKMEHSTRKDWTYLIRPKRKLEGRVMFCRNKEEIAECCEKAQHWRGTSNRQDIIAIIPRASAEFDLVLRDVAAVITAQGNKVAHLVTVAREGNVPVILCPNAFEQFKHYERIIIDGDSIRNAR